MLGYELLGVFRSSQALLSVSHSNSSKNSFGLSCHQILVGATWGVATVLTPQLEHLLTQHLCIELVFNKLLLITAQLEEYVMVEVGEEHEILASSED